MGWQRAGLVPVSAFAASALVAVVLVTGPFSSDATDETASGATTSPSATPGSTTTFLLRDCWIPTPEGNVPMTGEQAQALTTLAATVADGTRGEGQLTDVVRTELTDATESQLPVAVDSLLGRKTTERLNCGYSRGAVEPEEPGPSGLTPRARKLRAAWTDVFGPLIAGGFARGGVTSGHLDGSAHYDGRAIDVFFRPYDDAEQRRQGRLFAQWLVAHASRYDVLSVIYADQIWTSWGSMWGWRAYEHPSGGNNPVLRHLDHVHVAVESGEPWRGR
jgi:hypothetical protein